MKTHAHRFSVVMILLVAAFAIAALFTGCKTTPEEPDAFDREIQLILEKL